jgi:hypothetical protein
MPWSKEGQCVRQGINYHMANKAGAEGQKILQFRDCRLEVKTILFLDLSHQQQKV